MKYMRKFAMAFCAAALGMFTLTSCEGGDLYNVDSPDWLSQVIDSINANKGSDDEELEGMMEDVYTIGATDFSTGWWAQFSKYYQISNEGIWHGLFNLNINPNASNTYKNFALIICNDEDRGAANYKEYGAIRFDNQPSGNSEWGDYIDRSLVMSTLTFETDTDNGVDKLGGRVVLTIDRTGGGLYVKISNGTVVKEYKQTSPLPNLNADPLNNTIRAFLVPEGSYINFLATDIEPIGGCTSAEDKLPLSMELKGAPRKVLQGTDPAAITANITAVVQFEQGVSKTVTAQELTFESIPDLNSLGTKNLVAVYNRTYKGEYCSPVIAYVQFEVVDKMYTCIGNADNSSPWWSAHSENIKVGPNETFVSTFTNYTSGANNWNNFCVVLCNSDGSTEYAVVRADNYGWGSGYENNPNLQISEAPADWAAWLKAMDGAKVTTYVTNNGNGTADIEAVILGSDGNTYNLYYRGITVNSEELYFNFTIDNSHLEFDKVVGAEDNSSAFFADHSDYIKVPQGKTYTTRFKNFTSGANNWNNFLVVLTKADATEYAVVRADNYGWGDSYAACTPAGTQNDWAQWLAAMDEAMVTVSVTNNGSSADVKCTMVGNNGTTYTQNYTGIRPIDAADFYFHMSIDGSHLVFE